jgi:hypothetical protein
MRFLETVGTRTAQAAPESAPVHATTVACSGTADSNTVEHSLRPPAAITSTVPVASRVPSSIKETVGLNLKDIAAPPAPTPSLAIDVETAREYPEKEHTPPASSTSAAVQTVATSASSTHNSDAMKGAHQNDSCAPRTRGTACSALTGTAAPLGIA